MFGKKIQPGNTTIIGKGARFTGTLQLEGAVLIEGHCEGTLRTSGELSVGAAGHVSGEIAGKSVAVAGRVEGLIVASETLLVLSGGHVEGEAYYGKLKVDAGGVIDGRSHQGRPPERQSNSIPPVADEESGVLRTADRSVSAFPAAGVARASGAPGAR